MSRRQQIEAMLADDPNDPFLRYSLAMELQKEREHERSIELLQQLMADDPPYGAAFFMAAKQLVGLGRIDEARAALRDGIDLARRRGDHHAASEMSEYLTTLGQLGD
jgi:predicted Zn-dependent protease